MSQNHHTPYPFGGPLTAAAMEAPLGQLDAAIASVIATGSGASTSLTAQALAGQASLTVADSAGFAIGDAIFIGDAGGTHEARVVATVPNGTTITVTVNLSNTYAIGKPVSKSPVEIVDARGAYTDLGGRITAIETRVFDVKRYGAKGDGVTDDRASIRAAIDAAPAGSVILLTAGTYVMGSVIGGITKALHYVGHGATLKAGADGLENWAIDVGDGVTAISGVSIRGIAFDSASRARSPVNFNKVTDAWIEDCSFTGYSYAFGASATDSAIRLSQCSRVTVADCIVREWLYGNNGGANLHRAVTIQSTSDYITVRGLVVDTADQGIIVAGGSRIAITGCVFRNMSDNPIYVLGGTTGLMINGCLFDGAEEAIVLAGDANTTVALTSPFGDAATDLITATAHGFAANDAVRFITLTGGSGLSIQTIYYVRATNLTANAFELSAYPGGAKIDFTTNITAGSITRVNDSLTDVAITGCRFVGSTNKSIAVAGDTTRVAVTGCVFKHTADAGFIHKRTDDGGVWRDWVISGNVFAGPSTTGAVYATSIIGMLFSGNQVHVTFAAANRFFFRCDAGVADLLFSGNVLDSSGGANSGRLRLQGTLLRIVFQENVLGPNDLIESFANVAFRGHMWNAAGAWIGPNGKSVGWAAAAPTNGTWAVGDIIYSTAPTAGGFVGWVCTTAGTPGTWKTFGAISA